MQLIHALADTGLDGPDAYAECTCGERIYGDDEGIAYDGFQSHRAAYSSSYPR
jgi:hypothetical protein